MPFSETPQEFSHTVVVSLMYSSGNTKGPKVVFPVLFSFTLLLFKLFTFAYEIEISLCSLSKLKLLICICNSLPVWLALNAVCHHILHVYRCCSIPQSSALAWGFSWHKTVVLQLVQGAALLVVSMARVYKCLDLLRTVSNMYLTLHQRGCGRQRKYRMEGERSK